MEPLLALGPHIFATEGLNYTELERKLKAAIARVPRLGQRSARQWTGIDEESVTISGLIYHHEGRAAYEGLRASLMMGRSLLMLGQGVGLSGVVYGPVLLEEVGDTQEVIDLSGRGRKLRFDVKVQPDVRSMGGPF